MLQSSLAKVNAARHRARGLPPGAAPHVESSMFKTNTESSGTRAIDWTHHLSRESRLRTKSTLKASAHNPSAISLGTARPTPQYYPWESMVIVGAAADEKDSPSFASTASMSCAKGSGGYDLGIALNYGHAGGSPQLLRFVTEHVEMIHKPLYDDWECRLTCGNTSALEIVFRMLLNPGDYVLVEAYTYPGTIEAAKGLGINVMGVEMDDGGLIADDLDEKLCQWDHAKGPKPSILYTIPSGQNPTGTTQSVQRRKSIYRVAQEHDLLIVEDDPYYYLRLGDERSSSKTQRRLPLSPDDFIAQLTHSYLSLDTSGRVLRLDSMSKILAPGLRCGWITGCSQLIDKFVGHTEFSTVSPSGPSQMLLYKLMDETWGHEGFIKWISHLSNEYQRRRDNLMAACRDCLRSGICSWSVPSHGMFVWFQVDPFKHPKILIRQDSKEMAALVLEIEHNVFTRAIKNGVSLSRGSWFASPDTRSSQIHFRATFAAAAEPDLAPAIERFATALHEEFRYDTIPDLCGSQAQASL